MMDSIDTIILKTDYSPYLWLCFITMFGIFKAHIWHAVLERHRMKNRLQRS